MIFKPFKINKTIVDKKISIYLNNLKFQAINKKISSIAKEIDVSPSTITKFLKKSGYNGWKEYTSYLFLNYYQNIKISKSLINGNNEIKNQKLKNIEYIDSILFQDLKKLAKTINKSKKIILIGHGGTKNLIKMYKRNLDILGFNCSVYDMSDKYLNYEDNWSIVYFVFSISGLNSYLKQVNGKIISFRNATKVFITASNISFEGYNFIFNNKNNDIKYSKVENAIPIITMQFVQHIYDQFLFLLIQKDDFDIYKQFSKFGIINRIKK